MRILEPEVLKLWPVSHLLLCCFRSSGITGRSPASFVYREQPMQGMAIQRWRYSLDSL